eukprot:TRINITY_DN438_c1_g1_i2.p4 TRINITY_DN438_c1_g1~~TRINITY_DN438_c1_g1_i2.p4  ORF type:complete len:100 (-),score=10.15 TRINITY_DN438_c1_g1_i2:175-474(-)
MLCNTRGRRRSLRREGAGQSMRVARNIRPADEMRCEVCAVTKILRCSPACPSMCVPLPPSLLLHQLLCSHTRRPVYCLNRNALPCSGKSPVGNDDTVSG